MAKQFKPMLTQPPYNSKWWRRKAGGGVSPCIPGYPKYCRDGQSALANCCGWSWGRMAMLEDDPDIKVGCWPGNSWPADAQNWLEASKQQGFKTGDKPKLGAVAVWARSDWKSGHVANVEEIYDDGSFLASESGYGSYYWRLTRYNNKAAKSGYLFLGFIYSPTTWSKPKPKEPLAAGTAVKIIGTGNANSYGTGGTAYGIGWTRTILKVWDGRPFPYQVGNSSGTTGFYKAEALEVINDK